MRKFIEQRYPLIVGAILLFIFTASIFNANNDSLIYDELAHIPAGYSYLKNHDLRLNPEHPPLLKNLAALPLLFFNPTFDTNQPFWNENANDAQWNAGKYFLFGAGNNPDQIAFWSRVPFILLSLVLGWFIFFWARELAGTLAGITALLLFAFDPNILGHNHYVTTDLGIAAFITFALYFSIRCLKKPSWRNVAWAGLFLGLVQLTKFSSVLLFPVLGVIFFFYPLVKNTGSKLTQKTSSRILALGAYLGKGLAMFGISLFVVWIVYAANSYAMPKEKLPEIVNHYFHTGEANPKEVITKRIIFGLNEHPLSRPLATYFFGVARVFQRVAGGNVTYFVEEISSQGFLWYFPVVFVIKEPLPTLLLILACLVIGFNQILRKIFTPKNKGGQGILGLTANYIRTQPGEFSMWLFIIIYSLTSITGRLNIGFRHLFPILPFIFILVGKNVSRSLSGIKELGRKFNIWLIYCVIFAFLISGTIFAYPHYLSYFNELVGGPKEGYKIVTDSNTDWGQDLKRLRDFLKENPQIEKIRLNYFGLADPQYYLGNRYINWWDSKRPIEPGWYGISTLFFQESIYSQNRPDNQTYRWLSNRRPDYQVGTSLLIYNISAAEACSVNQ